jgi:hypothetical protein
MDTRNCLCGEKGNRPSDYERAVHQLRAAAARGQSEALRGHIRAATRC